MSPRDTSGEPGDLFHFSEDPAIRVFAPRPVRVGVDRGQAGAWLNGPLVWAIDAAHSLLYLFPRDCPRIVIWPTERTTPEDRRAWFGDVTDRAVAYVEEAWSERIATAAIQRYRMPAETFEPTGEPGTWGLSKPGRPCWPRRDPGPPRRDEGARRRTPPPPAPHPPGADLALHPARERHPLEERAGLGHAGGRTAEADRTSSCAVRKCSG